MNTRTDTHPRSGILIRATPADQGLVKLPALAPHLQFRVIGERQTLLVSESFNTLLHGRLYPDLLPLLDGRHAQQEIVAKLADAHAAVDVLAAIVTLSAKGYAVSAEHGMDAARAAYWSSLGASPRWVEQRLAESRVAVEGGGGRLAGHLEASGARVGTHDSALTVIVCEDYLDARGWRRQIAGSLNLGAPWALARPRGIEPLFGPCFPTGWGRTLLGLPRLPPAQPPGGA